MYIVDNVPVIIGLTCLSTIRCSIRNTVSLWNNSQTTSRRLRSSSDKTAIGEEEHSESSPTSRSIQCAFCTGNSKHHQDDIIMQSFKKRPHHQYITINSSTKCSRRHSEFQAFQTPQCSKQKYGYNHVVT
jgi:uncharacterized protein YlaI